MNEVSRIDSELQQKCEEMKTIEISEELYEYLKKARYNDCAEAWYTAQLKLDLDDLDEAIKFIIEDRDNWKAACLDDKLKASEIYPWSHTSTQKASET